MSAPAVKNGFSAKANKVSSYHNNGHQKRPSNVMEHRLRSGGTAAPRKPTHMMVCSVL
jgi:hypothetical protein